MPKGPYLTYEIKKMIIEIHFEHPDYGPTDVRKNLLKKMKEIGLDRNFGPNYPGTDAVGKLLREVRKLEEIKGPDPKMKPWTLLSLADYDIPPEALPTVMQIQARAIKQGVPFYIKDALWVGRLYHLFKGLENPEVWLRAIARVYRIAENLKKAMAEISELPDPVLETWLHLWDDAIVYLIFKKDYEFLQIVAKELFRVAPQLEEYWNEKMRSFDVSGLTPGIFAYDRIRKQTIKRGAKHERSHNQKIQE